MPDARYQPKGRAVAELHLVNESCCVAGRTFLKFTFTQRIITAVKFKVQPIFKQNNNEKKCLDVAQSELCYQRFGDS